MRSPFISPEAQKRRAASVSRNHMWQPDIELQDNELRARHAPHNRKGQARATATALLAIGWFWDGQPGARYFAAPATPENLKAALDALRALDLEPVIAPTAYPLT